nr:glycosyltransferase [Desulfovibrio sp.]
AKTMGENAKKRVSHITWEHTVKTLIDHAAKTCLTRIPIPEDRPRVLVLLPFPFSPDSSCRGRRLRHLCKALSKNAFVLLISLSMTASEIPKAEEYLPNFWSLALRPATGETHTSSQPISFSAVPHIREILSSYTDIGCVLIPSSSLYPFLNAALPNVPLLYDAQDIFSSKSSLREEPSPSEADISRHSMDMEKACCKNAALILASSNEERGEIERLFSPDKQAVLVLPDGCNTAAFSVLTRAEKKALRNRLPYTGAQIALFEGENTECDLDAARFILDLAPELSAVDILMAGSVSDAIRDLHIQLPDNVHLLGKIPDGERRLLLAGADIGLFPVRSFTKRGSNLQDAILAGLEGVALEPALRGLPKESLLCIRKARESDFADTVINALAAPSSDSDRQKAAKALASRGSWEKTLAPLEALLSQKALFPPKESLVPCTPAPCYKTSEHGLRIFLKSLYAASPLPKLLVCCSLSVRYPMSGGERRLFHVSEALSRHGNVLLIVYGDEEQREIIVQNLAPRLWQIRLPWRSDALASSREIFSRTREPSQDVSLLMHCADDPLLHSLLASQNDATLVLVSHPYLFPAVAGAIPDLPLIYDAHNVEADMKQVIFTNTEPEILSRVLETEKKCCERAFAVLACSEENKKRFHTLYGTDPAKIHIVPNGCDTDIHTFTPPEKRRLLRQKLPYPDTKLALFLGSYHKPNIEAVRLIIDLAGHLPDLHVLVGGGVAPAFRDSCSLPKNVHILGLLTEETKNLLLSSVDLALNPMLSGSGTNLKMLEYIAAGLETVSTPFGMRGIPEDLSESVHTVAINDFADTVARILKAPASEEACRKAAMKVADLYSWRSTMRPLENLLRHYMEEDASLTAEKPPI